MSDPSLPDTISLIGMPGVGKSTVGVLLAKLTGLRFADTDLDIQVREGATLQEILERDGHLRLREIEQQVLLQIPLAGAVVSTGGSVVYSDSVMARLRAAGPVIYLAASREVLEHRIAAAPLRGIASDPGQGFDAVYAERTPLYRRHADLVIDADAGGADQVAAAILSAVHSSTVA